MSPKRSVWKTSFKIILILVILFLLFFVNLNSVEDKCSFLAVFKQNINWLEHIVETYSSLLFAAAIIGVLLWSMMNLSISIKEVSLGGFEVTLKDTDKAVKNNIKNYLNTKRSLFCIKPEYDNFCEVFDSYHTIYDFLRNQILEYDNKKKTKSAVYSEIQEMLKELNQFLTVHQSNYRRWFALQEKAKEADNTFIVLGNLQKEYPLYSDLIDDIGVLNEAMKKHAVTFNIDMLDWEKEKKTGCTKENEKNR